MGTKFFGTDFLVKVVTQALLISSLSADLESRPKPLVKDSEAVLELKVGNIKFWDYKFTRFTNHNNIE